MKVLIHPPTKSGVTRVTSVTGDSKPLNILNLTSVTRLRQVAYTSCNAKSASLPLPANHFRRARKRSARWLCRSNAGRGIECFTRFEILVDD